MLLGTVQLSGETLSNTDVRDICESLRTDSIKLLSLRGCRVSDRHFTRMMSALSNCKSISQLNFNLGVVCNKDRVYHLAKALDKNRSLTGLFLNGSPLGDKGLAMLIDSLATHPGIVCLDVGHCQLLDQGVSLLCRLLLADGAKPGLKELTLSANPGVTPVGWANLAMAMAAGCCLRVLNVDYNRLGDLGAGVLAVATAACKTIQVLDLESTGISETGAKVLLTLANKYPNKLSDLVVKENNLQKDTEQAISEILGQPDGVDEDEDSSSSDDDSDGEMSREKLINRSPRHVTTNVACSNAKNDERYFERTAMRLLKRTASWDSSLPRQHLRHCKDSTPESDSEYSSASSNLEGEFLVQSQLLQSITDLKIVDKHEPLMRVPRSHAGDEHVPLIKVSQTCEKETVSSADAQAVDGNGNEAKSDY